jgi:hypothetical protein
MTHSVRFAETPKVDPVVAEVKRYLSPQASKVYDHLLRAGSITNVEANAVHRVRSVSRRITEIRLSILNSQSNAVSQIVANYSKTQSIHKEFRRDATGQRYVRYHLVRR